MNYGDSGREGTLHQKYTIYFFSNLYICVSEVQREHHFLMCTTPFSIFIYNLLSHTNPEMNC